MSLIRHCTPSLALSLSLLGLAGLAGPAEGRTVSLPSQKMFQTVIFHRFFDRYHGAQICFNEGELICSRPIHQRCHCKCQRGSINSHGMLCEMVTLNQTELQDDVILRVPPWVWTYAIITLMDNPTLYQELA